MTIIKKIDGKIKAIIDGKEYDVKDDSIEKLAWNYWLNQDHFFTDSNSTKVKVFEQGIEIKDDLIEVIVHNEYGGVNRITTTSYAQIKQQSDDDNNEAVAIAFAEWIVVQGYKPSAAKGMWLDVYEDDIIKRISSKELFQIFREGKII